jgi:hypothetical protein
MTKLAALIFSVTLAASTSAHAQFAIGGFDDAVDNGLGSSYSGWACSTVNPAQTQQQISIVIRDGAGNSLGSVIAATSSRPDVAYLCGGNAMVGWSMVGFGGSRGTPLYAYAQNNQTGQPQLLNSSPRYARFWCSATNTWGTSCCSASYSSASVPPGGTVILTLSSSGYIPPGSISYLYGTKNGVTDEFGSPYPVTSGSFPIANSPGLSGSYERHVIMLGPDNTFLCQTQSATTVFQ